jgi:uncharacterized phage-associated protein
MENFKKLLHYVCDKTSEQPELLGSTKLNKVLWYTDLLAFVNHGTTITEEKYLKRQFGPVPANILSSIETLVTEDKIEVTEANFHSYVQKRYVSKSEAETEFMSKEQHELVDDVIELICNNHTASSISELSHNDIWEMANDGEEIPMFTAFTIKPGNITEDDIIWAKLSISKASMNENN